MRRSWIPLIALHTACVGTEGPSEDAAAALDATADTSQGANDGSSGTSDATQEAGKGIDGSLAVMDGSTDAAIDAKLDSTPDAPAGQKCLVYLHGRSSMGGATTDDGTLITIRPTAAMPFGPGRVWIYFPQNEFNTMLAAIKATIPAKCGQILLRGFSNGGAAAAKIYCSGETFGGRLVGAVIDDPTMDDSTLNCAAAPGMRAVVYYTGGIPAGPYNCNVYGYTCEGGSMVANSTYISRMGPLATLKPSTQTTHTCYANKCDGIPNDAAAWW